MARFKGELDLDSMTPEQQRVAIATDVIEQVRAEVFLAYTGSYLDIPVGVEIGRFRRLTSWIARRKPCEVCAIGAAAVSSMRLFDRWEGPDEIGAVHGHELRDHLRAFFSAEQLGLIESAFEGSKGFFRYATNRYPENAEIYTLADAVEWRWEIRDDAERLIAIFQNIVDHDGEFVPAQLPVPA